MAATPQQDKVGDNIASAYNVSVRLTPNTGPQGSRLVIACPDGLVVVEPDGTISHDSRPARMEMAR